MNRAPTHLAVVFMVLLASTVIVAAQSRAELEKKYGEPQRDKHSRWMFKLRPDALLTVIFKKDGRPDLMKLTPQLAGEYLSDKRANEIMHELWSPEELREDKKGFSMSMSMTGCNELNVATYQYFTMKTFKGCDGEKFGIKSVEITWKRMMLAKPKSLILRPEPRLQ